MMSQEEYQQWRSNQRKQERYPRKKKTSLRYYNIEAKRDFLSNQGKTQTLKYRAAGDFEGNGGRKKVRTVSIDF